MCLELSGEGVLDVPPGERRIGPVSVAELPLPLGGKVSKQISAQGLRWLFRELQNFVLRIIGRKHQPELHKRAVNPQCLKFMSRDHFSISFEAGQFRGLAFFFELEGSGFGCA